MPNFKDAKIYKIKDNKSDKVYIGSTCQPLENRLSGHKTSYKNYKRGNYNYVSSFDIIKNKDCDIHLLKKYPCKNKEQLHKK